MRRLHLVELGDLPWWPRLLRDGATDYLRVAVRATNFYEPVPRRLAAALQRSGATEILDLCSGGGGPWDVLLPALRLEGIDVRVRLSDFYPNQAAFEQVAVEVPGLEFIASPIDATHVPEGTAGFRTIFAGFHHFRPREARALLASAVAAGEGVAVFEGTVRRPLAIGLMFVVPLVVWLLTPRIRPFRWSRLFWTYLVPVIPLAIVFDGVVSCLRTYTPEEMLAMAKDVGPGYEWEAGFDGPPRAPIPLTYLIGTPARASRLRGAPRA